MANLQESGSNIITTMYYNNRLQPCRISVKNSGTAPGSCSDLTNVGNVMDLTYGFNYGSANNGNTASITNNINTARSQTYTYDELNRVSTAKTQATTAIYAWGLSFGYDPWANLINTTVTQGTGYSLSAYADGSNRLRDTPGSYQYDAAGNMTRDPINSSYTYNAEGELTSAAGVTYTYDGDGTRVQKATINTPPAAPTPFKLYWYGLGTDPLSESDASGNLTNEYIFLGGARIAMLQLSNGNAVNYYVADHLGSSRIVASSSGSVLDDSDFYPFGGERSYTSSSGNNYKFTGKERDTESGLDDFAARFYTSNYGRFLSPDDSKYMHPADPQTFNLYSYVANNPNNAVDPTGHDQEGPGSIQWRRSNMHMDGGGPTSMGGGGSVQTQFGSGFLAESPSGSGDGSGFSGWSLQQPPVKPVPTSAVADVGKPKFYSNDPVTMPDGTPVMTTNEKGEQVPLKISGMAEWVTYTVLGPDGKAMEPSTGVTVKEEVVRVSSSPEDASKIKTDTQKDPGGLHPGGKFYDFLGVYFKDGPGPNGSMPSFAYKIVDSQTITISSGDGKSQLVLKNTITLTNTEVKVDPVKH